jgi:hypothetical protein
MRSTLRKPLALTALALVVVVLAAGWFFREPPLPRFPLRDGGEFRVYQIVYTSGPSDSFEHNLHAPRLRWRVYRRLPDFIRWRIPAPGEGVGGLSSRLPMLSIWWGYVDPKTGQPEIGPAGDVLMTLDSGEVVNLGWPSPYDDESVPSFPSYRQITVTPPPMNSRTLAFEVPTEGGTVRFTIENPAYRRP